MKNTIIYSKKYAMKCAQDIGKYFVQSKIVCLQQHQPFKSFLKRLMLLQV